MFQEVNNQQQSSGFSQNHMQKALWALAILLIAGAIVFAGILFYSAFKDGRTPAYSVSRPSAEKSVLEPLIHVDTETGATSVAGYVPSVVHSDAGTLPFGFPAELMLERGRVIRESFRMDFEKEGRAEMLVSYTSGLSLQKNIKLFTDYFAKSGWEPKDGYEEADNAVLRAVRGMDGVHVAVIERDGEALVRIVFYERSAAAMLLD